MKTFNEKMTIEEATILYNFKGSVMYPDTKHNREMMAKVVDIHLKKLQNK